MNEMSPDADPDFGSTTSRNSPNSFGFNLIIKYLLLERTAIISEVAIRYFTRPGFNNGQAALKALSATLSCLLREHQCRDSRLPPLMQAAGLCSLPPLSPSVT